MVSVAPSSLPSAAASDVSRDEWEERDDENAVRPLVHCSGEKAVNFHRQRWHDEKFIMRVLVAATVAISILKYSGHFAAAIAISILKHTDHFGSDSGHLGHSSFVVRSSSSAHADISTHHRRRRSFVCITGQLERLELENKIGTVLNPLRQAGYEPDIALILDASAALHVTNKQKVDFNYSQSRPFTSFDDAVEYLRGFKFNVVTDLPYSQVAEPILNEEYVNKLRKRTKMSMDDHRERAKNNIRMLETWAQCYKEMKMDLERAKTYDVVVRIREDVGFIQALDVEDNVKDLSAIPKSVISNGCRQNRGMNDKYAILSLDAARSYFEDPFRYYYAKPLHKKMMSSESFIYYTYKAEGLTVYKGPKIRHIVKLVSDDDGKTHLFPEEKHKLIKACNIEIVDEVAPNACTSAWIASDHRLETQSRVCWPYKYVNFTHHLK